ncbi:MAG: SoxR reducing system RseC family protein [Candidatus Thiodiazotropha sp.]
MIEESATVLQVDDGYAIVTTQQRAACGSCDNKGSCSTTVLSGLFKRRQNQLKVLNPIAAQPGEEVVIGLQEQALLKVSLTAYLLPLACMLLSAIIAQAMSERFMLLFGELPTILGGLLGLIIGLYLFRALSRRRASDPDYQAVILRQAMTQKVPFV